MENLRKSYHLQVTDIIFGKIASRQLNGGDQSNIRKTEKKYRIFRIELTLRYDDNIILE